MTSTISVNMSSSSASNTFSVPTLQPETEALRRKLRTMSFFLLGCGIIGFFGAFATYIGFMLAVSYMVAAGATISHTKDTTAVLNGTCCWGPNGFFHSLRIISILNAVGTCIGILVCAAGIWYYNDEGGRLIELILAGIALVACLFGLPLSIVTAQTAGKLHEDTEPLMIKFREMIVAHQGQVVVGTVAGNSFNDDESNNNNSNIGAGGQPSGYPSGEGHHYAGTSGVQVYPAAVAVDSTPAAYEQQPGNV